MGDGAHTPRVFSANADAALQKPGGDIRGARTWASRMPGIGRVAVSLPRSILIARDIRPSNRFQG